MFEYFIFCAICLIYLSTLVVFIDDLLEIGIVRRLGEARFTFWKRYLGYGLLFGWLLGMSTFIGNGLFDALFFIPNFFEQDEAGDMVSGKKAICHGLGFMITLIQLDKMSKK